MAQLRALAAEVTRLFYKKMVPKHFLRHELGQEALVHDLVNLHEMRLPARNLSDLVEKFGWSVVDLCGKDASSENGITVLDDGFDELACGCISNKLSELPTVLTYQYQS